MRRSQVVFASIGLAAAGLLLTACAASSPAVPVTAATGGLAALAGEWRGEYAGRESGRSGSIVFSLRAGADTAYGDVVMVPQGADAPYRPAGRGVAAGADPRRLPQSLQIAFVRLAGDSVSGTLEPYVIPDCACTVHTRFTGRLHGDRIEGSFRTVGTGAVAQTGQWWVARK